MATASTAPLPYPELHTLVTDNDHGPVVTIVAAFCMSMMLLFFFVRLAIRLPLSALFSYDDAAVTVATCLAAIQAVLVMSAVTYGLGQKIDDMHSFRAEKVLKMVYADSLLYVLALGAGKIAMTLLLYRLSASSTQRTVSGMMSILVAVWCFGGLLVVALQNDVRRPWSAEALRSHSAVCPDFGTWSCQSHNH
jgi:hypothetical protein